MYRINEIFYSLQGEGYHTGTPAVFVRFSGCNLRCPFCDTDHEAGQMMTDDQIICEIGRYPARMVVLTGGEPLLWIDRPFIDRLHAAGYYIAIETNGTRPLPPGIDWVTCSPKPDTSTHTSTPTSTPTSTSISTPTTRSTEVPALDHIAPLALDHIAPLALDHIDELKVVYQGQDVTPYEAIPARHYFLQPCSGQNVAETIACVMAHPRWRLSLQTHRIVGIR